MSSVMRSLLDPKKGSSVSHHVKAAISGRFRSYGGARCDELGSKEAFNRLLRESVDAQRQGIKGLTELPPRRGENLKAMQSPFRSSLLAHARKETGLSSTFSQARFSSSVASAATHSPTKNVLRPLSPHLPVYQPQLDSTLSITHRITAIYLTVVVLGFYQIYMSMAPYCLSNPSFYQFLFYSSKLHTIILELAGLAIAFQAWSGMRHLRHDLSGSWGKKH